MRYRALLCLPLCLLPLSVCHAGIPTDRFEIGLPWGGEWYIDGTRIKRVKGGQYLAYDPSGKDRGVFLVGKPGKGTDWWVAEPDKRREEDRGDIRAGSGPLKGWYLCVEGGRPVLRKGPYGKVQVRRVFDHK
jgi:hypothetical protein